MRQATATPSPTPTPTPDWQWATPTLYPTPAATNFLSGVVPTVVEAYAESAEQAVQMYNVSNVGGVGGIGRIDYVFLAMFLLVIFIGIARFWKRLQNFGSNENE